MTIIKRPAAKQDLVDCGSYIALDDPIASHKFLDAADKAFELLAKMPEMGPTLRQHALLASGGIPKLRGVLLSAFRRCRDCPSFARRS